MPDWRSFLAEPSMTAEIPPVVTLDKLRVGVVERIGAQVAHDARLTQISDVVTGDLLINLETLLLADELPPNELVDTVHVTIPRFASPWQHFKARYRDRWWMWFPRDFGLLGPVRYVDEPYTHSVRVEVRNRWTYPRSSVVLPDTLGRAVFHAETTHEGELRPW